MYCTVSLNPPLCLLDPARKDTYERNIDSILSAARKCIAIPQKLPFCQLKHNGELFAGWWGLL